jgi:hypothetical protein
MAEADPAPAPRDRRGKERPRIWFKFFAVLIPSLAGFTALTATMLHQERLVVSFSPFAVRFQSPPIYLQEEGHELSGHRYIYDKLLGWKNIPNWSATTRGRPLNINSRGLRDREYPYAKPAGTQRILVLGDSFTWGYGVGDSEIFTEVLEAKLASERLPWEVINTGVSGWGTDQELLFLKSEGHKYSPDIVILALYLGNDWANNTALTQYGFGKPCFADTNLSRVIPPTLQPQSGSEFMKDPKPVEMTMALIHGVNEICQANHASLMLVLFGAYGATPNSAARPFSQSLMPVLARDLKDRNILILDLDRSFAASRIPPEVLFAGNIQSHWNARGHAIVADLILRHLANQL